MEGLSKLINEAVSNGVFPGGNYCLVNKGKKSFASFGARALYPEYEANDLNTVYDMASCSKVVATTTAIMILLEQGRLRLYDAVKTYLPFFPKDNVTVWDLLTHSSGLISFIGPSNYKNKAELINLIKTTEMKYEKNTKIVYSDIGFITLGWIIEAISGMGLDEFCDKFIFTPLEMTQTCYNPQEPNICAPTEDRKTHIDRGYVHDEAAHTLGGVAGHAGLFSTVGDISNFIEMILNDGMYQGKKILSKRTIDLLFTPQVEEANGVAKTLNRRGLGWIIKGDYPCSGDLVSPNTIMHTGFTGTHIFIDRDNKVGFSLLTNRVHPTRDNTLIIAFRAKVGNYIMSNLVEEKMIVRSFQKNDVTKIVNLWNSSVVPYSIYKEFTNEYFIGKFVNNKYFDSEGFKLLFDGSKLIAYGHAIINDNPSSPGFITLIAVDKDYQRQGYGSLILKELEAYLASKGKTLIRLFFASPINLEWYIPNTEKADHPGAPAVPYNTPYYFLFLANGYNTNGQLDAYYLDITGYEIPEKVIKKEEENEKLGYSICLYDEAKHFGFPELFAALKNEGWHDAVKNNLAKDKPAPMLIAQKEGEILGWTGPMYTQDSGRGYFAGIGVHPKTQGLGLGKSLFCHLCHESKLNGAKFMTLFTGSDNPARNIYLYAGFKVRQSFAIMRKELK